MVTEKNNRLNEILIFFIIIKRWGFLWIIFH